MSRPPERIRIRECNRWICDLIFCAECGQRVPVFHDLAPSEAALLEKWRRTNQPDYPEIAAITGLSKSQARRWLSHQQTGIERKGRWNSATCPKCRLWLRSPKARRCFHCGHDCRKNSVE